MQTEIKLNIEIKHDKGGIYRRFLKRPMDCILSLIAIIILSPVLLLVAILVKIKLGSPVIFKQNQTQQKMVAYASASRLVCSRYSPFQELQ